MIVSVAKIYVKKVTYICPKRDVHLSKKTHVCAERPLDEAYCNRPTATGLLQHVRAEVVVCVGCIRPKKTSILIYVKRDL